MAKHSSRIKQLLRFLPLLVIIIALALAVYFRLYEYLSFTSLQQHHQQLLTWTQQHYFLILLIYMVIYIIAVAISIPGATILTIAGGLLFGIIPGTIYVVISATIGATLLFLATKTSLGNLLKAKAGPKLHKLEKGFQHNAFSYLLVLRLIPLFPFWLINIVPAVLNVRLRTFVTATFLGIIPGSFVYVLLGNGVSSVLDAGQTPNLGIIFQPAILAPLIGLAALALVPIIYKKIKAKNKV